MSRKRGAGGRDGDVPGGFPRWIPKPNLAMNTGKLHLEVTFEPKGWKRGGEAFSITLIEFK